MVRWGMETEEIQREGWMRVLWYYFEGRLTKPNKTSLNLTYDRPAMNGPICLVILVIIIFISTAQRASLIMPQNDYMDLHKKRFGERLDAE